MYRMFAAGQAKYQEQIGQTHRYVSDWVRQIAFEAMTSHRFLTPDRTVQETEFANGSGVVVNFGDKEYALPDGPVIKPAITSSFAAPTKGGPTHCPQVQTYSIRRAFRRTSLKGCYMRIEKTKANRGPAWHPVAEFLGPQRLLPSRARRC